MRLTLRTLLAWMDDTLDPDQVREIGKQVAESPFARELTDRINRVTRQRRLSVPSRSGPDGTDPNVVAGYLDNDLDPEEVAEFEKRCLTADVNLAEVASVHQILSLLGQKVTVPAEARSRMYQLVKGRETIPPRRSAPRRPQKEPVTRPIQPWALPDLPRRPWIERYGPAVACAVLIIVAVVSARESLRPPGSTGTAPTTPPASESAGAAATQGMMAAMQPAQGPPPGTPGLMGSMVADTTPGPEAGTPPAPPSEAAKGAEAAEKEKAKPAPPPDVPAGVAALAEKSDGILLRYSDDKREWERIDKETRLKTSDRILCIEPFRAAVDLGKIRVNLIHETEIRILSQSADTVPAIELIDGRIVIREPGAEAIKVAFGRQSVTLELATDSIVGLERVNLNMYGQPVAEPASLGILCQQGNVTVVSGEKKETLHPRGIALVGAAGEIQTGERPSLPDWLAKAEPTPSESEIRDQFAKLFHADRPVLAEVVAAVEDERAVIKPLAVGALKALGDLSLLMPTLSRPNDPVARRASIQAIRSEMMMGPDASARVRSALDEEFGAELGGFAHHMLVGFAPEDASKPDLFTRLVGLLSPDQESVGLRELALDTLRRLTGRDDLGYDPDKPAGKGYDAWNDLLRRNELRLPPAPTPGRPPTPGPTPGRQPKSKVQR